MATGPFALELIVVTPTLLIRHHGAPCRWSDAPLCRPPLPRCHYRPQQPKDGAGAAPARRPARPVYTAYNRSVSKHYSHTVSVLCHDYIFCLNNAALFLLTGRIILCSVTVSIDRGYLLHTAQVSVVFVNCLGRPFINCHIILEPSTAVWSRELQHSTHWPKNQHGV
jgi:hypothetical protein